MSDAAAPGRIIAHAANGWGVIVAALPARRVLVRFDTTPDMPRSVPIDELLDAPPPEARIGRSRLSDEAAVALQALEAFRLGIVPAAVARRYTVARESALASIDRLFEARQGLRVIWGDYGSGKTHLLEVAERAALDQGFVTARIVLDPTHVPPHHPKRLWARVVSSLRFPDDAGQGIAPVLDRLRSSDEHAKPSGARMSRFLSPLLFAWQRDDDEALGWIKDWLMGDKIDGQQAAAVARRIGWTGPYLLTLSDFRTYARMYIHMLGALAAWVGDAGWRGLVLFFDEVERVDILSLEERLYALTLLQYFAAATLPRSALAFDPETLPRGGQEVHRAIPLVFAEDQNLSAVFTLTPLGNIVQLLTKVIPPTPALEIVLSKLKPEDGNTMIRRIVEIYLEAHPAFDLTSADLDRIEREIAKRVRDAQSSPRVVVRAVVGMLDAVRMGMRK